MQNPQSTSPGSIMPPYAWLLERKLDVSDLPAKIRALQTLGTPYPAGYADRAAADLRPGRKTLPTTSGKPAWTIPHSRKRDHRHHRLPAAPRHRHQTETPGTTQKIIRPMAKYLLQDAGINWLAILALLTFVIVFTLALTWSSPAARTPLSPT